MPGARIGGNIGDMEGAAEVMGDTGTAASDTGTEASGVSAQMEVEINDVTNALSTHFQNLHQQLTAALVRNRDRLGSTDWEGQAYQEALRAEADLNSQTTTRLNVSTSSTAGERISPSVRRWRGLSARTRPTLVSAGSAHRRS